MIEIMVIIYERAFAVNLDSLEIMLPATRFSTTFPYACYRRSTLISRIYAKIFLSLCTLNVVRFLRLLCKLRLTED